MLSVVPFISPFRRAEQTGIGLVQPVEHRPDVCVIELEMQYVVFPYGVLVSVIADDNVFVFVLPARPRFGRIPAIGDDEGVRVLLRQRLDDQRFVVHIQLGNELVQEHGGAFVCVGRVIPHVILAFADFFVVLIGAEFTPAERGSNHIDADPKGQLANLVFLRGFDQFFAGNLTVFAFPVLPAQPFEKMECRCPHLLFARSSSAVRPTSRAALQPNGADGRQCRRLAAAQNRFRGHSGRQAP